MYSHILVPLDGSPLSARALSYAIPLAEQHGARLHLLHVAAPSLRTIVEFGRPARDPSADQGWLAEERKAVERIAKRARGQTAISVEVAFRGGRPAAEIAAYARESHIGLIVMCTHGRGGFERLWLGSVTDAVLRDLPVPLLLVRGARGVRAPEPGNVLFPRVLVALDGSPHAEVALDAVAALVGTQPTAMTLLSVLNPAMAMGSKTFPSQAEKDLCAEYLEPLAMRRRTPERSIEVETAVTVNVGRGIIEHATRHNASLVALATQGLSGVQRAVVGSVADKLIRTAPMPVLVVPGTSGAR
jgi:nucleotide-binding universal stress UspA family protein